MSVYTDLVRYWELFTTLFRRDMQAKYKGSALGVLWSLANPLVMMGVYLVVFKVIIRPGQALGQTPYSLFLLSGLAAWIFFSQALSASTRSMLDNAQLIRKTRFPRQLLPLSVVATHLIPFAVMLAVLMPLNAALLPRTRDTFLLTLPMALLLVAIAVGLSLAVSALNVLFRDVEHLVTSLLLPWMFLTPIFYALAGISSAGHPRVTHLVQDVVHYGNFMSPAILALRAPLFDGRLPSAVDTIYLVAAAIASLALGALVFRRLDDRIAVEL
jgi:ABC-type polysaccharide/polyol phosphate export permease